METKSLGPSVSKIMLMVCLAIFIFCPIIDPELSINITRSFGSLAASVYHGLDLESNKTDTASCSGSGVHSKPVEEKSFGLLNSQIELPVNYL